MKTKLTLSIEKEIIEVAKEYVKAEGTNLSSLVEQYFKDYVEERKLRSTVNEAETEYATLSPEIRNKLKIVKELGGIFKTPDQDNRPYKEILQEELLKKYGDRKG